jgi:hypothetical protein
LHYLLLQLLPLLLVRVILGLVRRYLLQGGMLPLAAPLLLPLPVSSAAGLHYSSAAGLHYSCCNNAGVLRAPLRTATLLLPLPQR